MVGLSLDDAYREYSKLLDTSRISKDDVYTELMKKETKLLDVMDRIAVTESNKTIKTSLFYNRPVIEIISTFVNTWRNIFNELVVEDGYKHLDAVFWNEDRKIYVGLMIVVVSFLLFFIEIS